MTIQIHFLCKRYYTNKDLIKDHFGRLFHLPVALSKLGAKVTVTALDYRSTISEKMIANGVAFQSIPATFSRLPRLVLELNRIAAALAPDFLVASGDSHIGFLGKYLARRIEARFVFDVYDYYPSFPGNRIPGFKAMFRSAVRSADLILCASEPLRNMLAQVNRNTLLVENGVDRQLFRPMDKQYARTRLELEAYAPYVGYFGSITPNRGPLLIEACQMLRSEIPELRLLLAGPVKGVNLDKPGIIYYGVLPQESIPERIAACDVVVIPYEDDVFNRMSGPCKVAEYLACERPVIATNILSHIKVSKPNFFSLCRPEVEDIAIAIKKLIGVSDYSNFPEELDWKSIGDVVYRFFLKSYGDL
jgi:glycosyltransferase involved in cell wall biosynthesis